MYNWCNIDQSAGKFAIIAPAAACVMLFAVLNPRFGMVEGLFAGSIPK
jgi:hypothetical protein